MSEVEPANSHHSPLWAQHLTQLWQGQPVNMAAERAYNRAMSHRPPNCCICAFFKRFDVSSLTVMFHKMNVVILSVQMEGGLEREMSVCCCLSLVIKEVLVIMIELYSMTVITIYVL